MFHNYQYFLKSKLLKIFVFILVKEKIFRGTWISLKSLRLLQLVFREYEVSKSHLAAFPDKDATYLLWQKKKKCQRTLKMRKEIFQFNLLKTAPGRV